MLFRRAEECTIVADLITTTAVKRFAKDHALKNEKIKVWMPLGYHVYTFKTKTSRMELLESLDRRFKDVCNVQFGENLIFVTNRTEA